MDADRFDALAKSWSGRRSRRSALRSAAGLATGVVGGVGLGRDGAAEPRRQASASWYVVVRRYRPSAPADQLRQALSQGYAPLLGRQPGFVEYFVFASAAEVTSITVFETDALEEAATQQLGDWVQQNLAPLLPAPEEVTSGTLIVHAVNAEASQAACPAGPTPAVAPTAGSGTPSPTALPVCTDPARPGVGCPCTTGTRNPCGDTTLVCCLNDPNGPPGGPGTCTPASVGCEATGPTG